MKWSHVFLLLLLFSLVISISGIFFPPYSTPEERGAKMFPWLFFLAITWLLVREYEKKHWYNLEVKFTESKEYEKALNAYDQALINNDKNPDIWNNKCFVLIKLGRCNEAIIAGNNAVKLKPNDPELWDTLRQAEKCQKNNLRARK